MSLQSTSQPVTRLRVRQPGVRVPGWSRCVAVVGALVAACLLGAVTAPGVSAQTPLFTEVAGSPFPTGGWPFSVAISPDSSLVATANANDNTVSVFSVGAAGALTQVGTPAATGLYPYSVTFSPDGRFLATANDGSTPSNGTVSMFSVSPGGVLTPVGGPVHSGYGPYSVSFSPDGTLLAVANTSADEVQVFTVSGTGVLAKVGPAVAVGDSPLSAVFSPRGGLLAVANQGGDSISVFSVSTGGQLTAVSGSPYSTGAGSQPNMVAFSPDGELLATANTPQDAVSLFSVASGGQLTAVSGSPFATGDGPNAVAFGPGRLLATADWNAETVSVFSISPGNALTPVAGSPYATGSGTGTCWTAFSPNGGLLATANCYGNSVTMFLIVPPTAEITSPADAQSYALGQNLPTSFACADTTTGITSCMDSNGGSGTTGSLDTSTAGTHTYTVTATAGSGQGATKSITYTVREAVAPTVPAVVEATAPVPAVVEATAPVPAGPTSTAPVCLSTRVMRLHWNVPAHRRLGAFSVRVNGRSVATLARSRRAVTVSLRGRTAQTVRVRITAKTKAGVRYGTTRTFTTCSTVALRGRLATLQLERMR